MGAEEERKGGEMEDAITWSERSGIIKHELRTLVARIDYIRRELNGVAFVFLLRSNFKISEKVDPLVGEIDTGDTKFESRAGEEMLHKIYYEVFHNDPMVKGYVNAPTTRHLCDERNFHFRRTWLHRVDFFGCQNSRNSAAWLLSAANVHGGQEKPERPPRSIKEEKLP